MSLPAGTLGLLAPAGEHADLTVSDDVDVLVLDDASPTARFSGLVGAQPLDQASPGLFPHTRIAAALEFYETDEFLVRTLSDFIATGFRAGDVVLVVATEAHRDALDVPLRMSNVPIFRPVSSR